MRNRRNRRRFKDDDILDNLKIFSKVLFVLIVVCLIIFINSSIHVKKSTLISKNNNLNEIAVNNTTENNGLNDNSSNNNVLNNNISQNTVTQEPVQSSPKSTTINMAITGDIMCHNTIYNDALNKSTNEYDFSYIFEDIKYHIQTADIAVGNLETTFAGPDKGYSSYPTFNTPENLAYTLKKVGFDVLSTANNHCYDTGYNGIESTINYLDDADISHTGTFKSEEEQNKILIKNVKGIQIAFLSFTYGTNGIKVPSDKSYSVNLIGDDLILKQLSLAKEQNPDLICVSMHWGIEYQTSPNAEQKRLADLLFQNGADIIIGNHPHVIEPMEKREITLEDGSKKDGFVVYSLGNFLADQNKTYTRNSAILNLNITKNPEGKISINSATYTPIYTYKDTSKSSQKFKLVDLENVINSYEAGYEANISKNVYNTFKTELENVRRLLGNEIK
jgi:poly-gamma-glutamate capsule biosynthesis protein CapA/YwtB (metallophosphatase superfamily)